MEAEALACERSPFDEPGTVPGARRALIFHDRVNVAIGLGKSLQLFDPVRAVNCFDDGFALTDAYGQDATAIVLVGYRRDSTAAAEATGLLLSMFPAAWVIGYGEADCAPLLVAAVTGGVRGVMLWSPVEPAAGPPPAAARRRSPPAHAGISRTPLTEREREILSQIAQGCSNHEIGRTLAVSVDA